MRPIDPRARELYADHIQAKGIGYQALALSIRAGFTNLWIEPALVAISVVLRQLPEDPE